MIWLGSADEEAARASWERLFSALAIERDEDVFARFLTDEIGAWTGESWGPIVWPKDDDVALLSSVDRDGRCYPARQFVADLDSIIAAKPLMTRRQWVSLLESVVRMAAVAHVAWLCEVQKRIWSCISLAISGVPQAAPTADEIYPEDFRYLTYGTGAISELKDRTSKYLKARLGINAALWALDEIGQPFSQGLSSAAQVDALCSQIRAHRTSLANVPAVVDEIADRESRTMMCRKGIGANLMEFARHVLYQRIAADDRLRGYDQGYLLRKRGPSKSSQWICAPGPVAVLAAVHCSLSGLSGPRSVHRLAQHLGGYGVGLDHRDIAQNELGHQLRTLGLVLDSPDAESGMLLVPPFASYKTSGGAR
jgi:hypothetical protein